MNRQPILIAEDDPADIFHARRIFQQAGVLNSTHVVRNGSDAIRYLEGSGIYADRDLHPFPGLVLLDLRMPGKSGLEVLRWLQDQSFPRPRMVMLTNVREMKQMNEAYHLGADSFLTKPLMLEDMVNLIERLPGIRIIGAENHRELEFA